MLGSIPPTARKALHDASLFICESDSTGDMYKTFLGLMMRLQRVHRIPVHISAKLLSGEMVLGGCVIFKVRGPNCCNEKYLTESDGGKSPFHHWRLIKKSVFRQ